jgi:hypothetical protein
MRTPPAEHFTLRQLSGDAVLPKLVRALPTPSPSTVLVNGAGVLKRQGELVKSPSTEKVATRFDILTLQNNTPLFDEDRSTRARVRMSTHLSLSLSPNPKLVRDHHPALMSQSGRRTNENNYGEGNRRASRNSPHERAPTHHPYRYDDSQPFAGDGRLFHARPHGEAQRARAGRTAHRAQPHHHQVSLSTLSTFNRTSQSRTHVHPEAYCSIYQSVSILNVPTQRTVH